MQKIIQKKDFISIRENLKRKNKTVVLCHGVFDLIHPGHLQHFQKAKESGDILVVSVTAEKYVRKGPGRPYFNDQLRMNFLEAIEYIDYVMLSESYTADDIIKVVQPDIYVKGQEYKEHEKDITGKITDEIELVQKFGGRIYYTDGEVFSSTRLINQSMPVFSEELKSYLSDFSSKYQIKDILNATDKMKALKVLVIGDTILDEYVFCKVQGMMSKDMGYSAKKIKSEVYLGGSLAIACHAAEFSENVTYMSIVGAEKNVIQMIEKKCQNRVKLNLVDSEKVETIIKTRYVEPDDKRNKLNKIFVVNNLSDNMVIDPDVTAQLKFKIKSCIHDYDVVFLSDFGHGLVDDEVIQIIQQNAKILILNCQTNSSNFGLNLITKYSRADFFTLDQKELRLAFSDYSQDEKLLLKKLAKHLSGRGCLTRGSKGAYSISDEQITSCPAFVLDITDTIGAGDAFFVLSGLAAAVGESTEVCMFMGNIAGALATEIIGNREHLDKVNILKYATTLLK